MIVEGVSHETRYRDRATLEAADHHGGMVDRCRTRPEIPNARILLDCFEDDWVLRGSGCCWDGYERK